MSFPNLSTGRQVLLSGIQAWMQTVGPRQKHSGVTKLVISNSRYFKLLPVSAISMTMARHDGS